MTFFAFPALRIPGWSYSELL